MNDKKCTDCFWFVPAGFLHCKKHSCNFNHDGFEPREKTIEKLSTKSNKDIPNKAKTKK